MEELSLNETQVCSFSKFIPLLRNSWLGKCELAAGSLNPLLSHNTCSHTTLSLDHVLVVF